MFSFQSKQSPGLSKYILTLGKQQNFLGPRLLTKVTVVHRKMSKTIQVNPLKIKGKVRFYPQLCGFREEPYFSEL